MFIAFEGLDGSGSSTHVQRLAERLKKEGHDVCATKEPTDTPPVGKMIRDILKNKTEVTPEALQLLFCADRAEHLKNVIEPALHNNRIVITDRYLFSTLAYGALATDWEWLKNLNQPFRIPDITFLLKLDPATCIQRIQDRGTEFQLFEKQETLKKVWTHYERVAKEYPNIHIIDSSRPIEEVGEVIWKIVAEKN